tara:strand:- start:303 stop:638 length:336 start_codon:yes stop_codon:yes gene_type:complete
MPLLNISTSQIVSEKQKLIEDSSEFLSKLLNKSENYVMVKLNDSVPIYFAKSMEPSCFIEIKSIGSLAPSSMSEQICNFFSKKLCVKSKRIYIFFDNVDSSMWAWDGRTFG